MRLQAWWAEELRGVELSVEVEVRSCRQIIRTTKSTPLGSSVTSLIGANGLADLAERLFTVK